MASSDRALARAAAAVAAGALLSGPLALALTALRPQPPWRDAETFIAHHHWLQEIPYALGFLLIGGSIAFIARAAAIAGGQHKTRAYAALVCAAAYAALIGANYTLQLAFVPHAVRMHDPAVRYFTMANPGAISWAFEMFGYGALGVATWLIAPVFAGGGARRWIRGLLIGNGVVSVAGAAITAIDLTWVMSTPGLVSFALWNLLFIAAMVLVAVRGKGGTPAETRPGRWS